MLGAAYAAVPLYELFCKVTGYGGTPRVADRNDRRRRAERVFTVRFDANVAPGLPWRFEPEQASIQARAGRHARRCSTRSAIPAARPTTGIASFNVLPELTGGFSTRSSASASPSITLAAGRDA